MFILLPIAFALVCASLYWCWSPAGRTGVRILRAAIGFLGYWFLLFLVDTAVVRLAPRLFADFGDAWVILSYELCAMLLTLLLGWFLRATKGRPTSVPQFQEAQPRPASKVSFECPHCHQQLTFLYLSPGEAVTCPLCGAATRAPSGP